MTPKPSGSARLGLSVPAFARRVGVNEKVIRAAIRTGRLERSVALDAKGRPRILDAALAEQEWETNRDPSKDRRPGSPARGTIAEIRARLVNAQARRAEIDNETREGTLVPKAGMDALLARLVVQARTGLLGIPTRAKQRLPHLTAADLVVLDGLIREALEALADAAPDAG